MVKSILLFSMMIKPETVLHAQKNSDKIAGILYSHLFGLNLNNYIFAEKKNATRGGHRVAAG